MNHNEADIAFMSKAIALADKSKESDDVPIACIIVRDGEIIAEAVNTVEKDRNATSHAELLAINKAIVTVAYKHLLDCDLYVTLEPCSMCAGAIVLARIKRLIFSAYDPKAGAVESLFSIANDERLNHKCEVIGGVLEEQSSKMLKDFFKKIRSEKSGKRNT